MPPADASRPAAPVQHRSPRLARTLLLAACAAGLVGLALPHAAVPATPAVQAASSSPLAQEPLLDPRTPHPAGAPRVVPSRASRSRALPRKPAAARRQRPLWVRPSLAGVVSPYGPRWGSFHKGVDFGASYGAPIAAVGDGVVIDSGYLADESGYGLITLIRHSNGFVTAYAHQSRSFVQAGQVVHAGDVIGLVGSTGHSTGPHLHFEVRTETHGGQIDPLPWLRAHGVSV